MLKIILSKKGASSKSGRDKAVTGENVTISCPDHLVLSHLPVAKSIGSVPAAAHVKHVGFSIPRKAGEKTHFCSCCDYPIAIYGRLSPCEHAFCLDCARSDSSCYTCKAHIQKITVIKKGNGVFICGLDGCLKSFLEENSLKAHIEEIHGKADSICANDGDHGDLCLQPINETLPRPFTHPNSPASFLQNQHLPSMSHLHNNSPHGFNGSNKIPHDHKGILSEKIPPEHSRNPHQPPKHVIPHSVVTPTPSCHHFNPHETQLLYPAPFMMAQPRPESVVGPVNVSPLVPVGQAGLSLSMNHPRTQNTQPVRVHVRSSYINRRSVHAFSLNDRARPISNQGDRSQNLKILLTKPAFPLSSSRGDESSHDRDFIGEE